MVFHELTHHISDQQQIKKKSIQTNKTMNKQTWPKEERMKKKIPFEYTDLFFCYIKVSITMN